MKIGECQKGGKEMMYRQYENPYKLEEQLVEAKRMLAENPDDEELAITVAELKDRINFAWQDDEFDGEEF